MRSRVVGAMVAAAILIGGYAVVGGGGGGGANWAGSFNCYGVQTLPSSCYTLASSCDASPTSSATLVSAISAATGGQVICIDTSSSVSAGTVSSSKSSDVTIQPAPGRTPTLTIAFSGANHFHVTGVTISGSLDLFGSTNITVDHSTWVPGTPGAEFCNNTTCGVAGGPTNANVLLDYDDFTRTLSVGTESRITFYTASGSGPNGWTVSHSLIADEYNGECADGIDTIGDNGSGITVGPGNEFTAINQGVCTNNAHADPIAMQGQSGITITSNYFHDNDGSGGIFTWADGVVIKNNVFLVPSSYGCIGVRGTHGPFSFTHNFVGPSCFMTDVPQSDGANTGTLTFTNTVWDPPGGMNESCSGCTYVTTYMLNSGEAGTGNTTENPLKIVASPASGYYHYELDSTSVGYHAASDGKSMGICSTCG